MKLLKPETAEAEVQDAEIPAVERPATDDAGRPLMTTLQLPCDMTDAERSERAFHMAQLALEIEQIERQQKRVKGLREEIAEVAHEVDSGQLMRDVRCMIFYDTPTPGRKRIVRLDTDDVVEELLMTAVDAQPELFGENGEGDPDVDLKMPDFAEGEDAQP